ncbi:DUF2510 domain-containing protein [Nocardioides solisilvae]|uniref:DUF2510 domain-containing protein n=1 Tax=Nocardioides solisilvae TaxID=1542435 RepID=UPI001952776C|nr:DUF2510 domain-containing protein [Nocardioides solisilvae]
MNAQPAGWYPDPHDGSKQRYWDGQAWGAQAPAPPSYGAPPPPSYRPPPPPVESPASGSGRWYILVPLLTMGLFAAVPFFHAASRLGRPDLRRIGAGVAATSLLGAALIILSPEDATGSPTGFLSDVGGVLLLGVMVVSTVLLVGLRRAVYRPGGVQPTLSPNVQAKGTVLEARRKRAEARRLAERDPLMARELGIGQPQSRHVYDDGGLLDLNTATQEQLQSICDLPADVAAGVVLARETLGRFTQVEDAVLYGPVPEVHATLLRERGLVIADR